MAQLEFFLYIFIRLAFPIDYDRTPGTRRLRTRGRGVTGPPLPANSAPPPASAALRQLAGDRVPFRLNRRDARLDRRLIRPIVRIETMGALGQPVTIFGRAGSACNPLHELTVTGTEAHGLPRPDRPAEQRFVLNNGRRWRLGRRPWALGFRPATLALARRSRRAIANVHSGQSRLAQEGRPIKRKIGVRVLQGLRHLRVEREATHPQAGRRSKEIEDAGAR
jgi:hypothetical protein